MSLWSIIFGNNIISKNDIVTYIFSDNLKIKQNKKFYLENLKTIFLENNTETYIEEMYINPWNNDNDSSKKKLSSILLSVVIYYLNGSSHFYTSITVTDPINSDDIEQIHINFAEPLSTDEENRLYKLFN
jgi:hypothetical protein